MNIDIIDDVLEVYINQTTDYDQIADQLDLGVLDVANIINEYFREVTEWASQLLQWRASP